MACRRSSVRARSAPLLPASGGLVIFPFGIIDLFWHPFRAAPVNSTSQRFDVTNEYAST